MLGAGRSGLSRRRETETQQLRWCNRAEPGTLEGVPASQPHTEPAHLATEVSPGAPGARRALKLGALVALAPGLLLAAWLLLFVDWFAPELTLFACVTLVGFSLLSISRLALKPYERWMLAWPTASLVVGAWILQQLANLEG